MLAADKPARKRLIIGVSIAVVALAAIGVALFLVLSPSDEDEIRGVIRDYAAAYNRSDLVAHESFWCKDNRPPADKITVDEKRNFGPAHTTHGRLDDLKIDSVKVEGDKATAEVVLDYEHGDPFHDSVHLVREDGSWKICGNAPDL